MKRRDFLRTATHALIVLPFGTLLVSGCGSDEPPVVVVDPIEPPEDGSPPDAPPRTEGASVVYTSSRTDNHAHRFAVAAADLLVLPLNGIGGTTTEDDGHVHALAITLGNLQRVLDGESVKVTTAVADGHTHVFTIVRIS